MWENASTESSELAAAMGEYRRYPSRWMRSAMLATPGASSEWPLTLERSMAQ